MGQENEEVNSHADIANGHYKMQSEYNRTKLEILIEPKFKKGFLTKFITRFNKLVTIALRKYKISFVIKNNSKYKINKLKLSNVVCTCKNLNYMRTFNHSFDIYDIEPNQTKITKEFEIVFSHQGLYWLDVEVDAGSQFEIETRQRTLEGKEGSGWPAEESHNICRTGIGVIDNLTSILTILTIIICLLTLLLIFLQFFPDLKDNLICLIKSIH